MGDWFDPDFVPQMPDDFDYGDYDLSELGKLNTRYVWNTWGDNCPVCDSLRGMVQTLDFWINSGISPGFHTGCDCTLKMVPADTPLSDPDIFGTNISLYGSMANADWVLWQSDFEFGGWLTDLREEAIAAYNFYGGELPIGEAWKLRPPSNPSTIFRQVHPFWNRYIGWRVFQQVRHYENIDGQFQGDMWLDLRNLKESTIDVFIGWFLSSGWYNRPSYSSNKPQYRRYTWPSSKPSGLSPVSLRAYKPMQSYYTEVE